MIDLDVIEAQCKSSIANGYGHLPVIDCGNAVKVMELITQLRQAEKDAARYQWLRESASTEYHGGFAYSFRLVDAIRYMHGSAPNETMDIDDAIDEAMNARNGGDL